MAVDFKQFFFYASTNLLFDQNADALVGVIRSAREAGATHLFLSDYQTGLIGDMPPRYFANVDKVRKAAADANITICPSVFSIGSSGRYLCSNPNLADGIPVRDMRFLVRSGVADPDPSLAPRITNPGFDHSSSGLPSGWTLSMPDGAAAAGASVSLDKDVKRSGAASLKCCPVPGYSDDRANPVGVTQRIAVQPFHLYTLTVWLKTAGVSPERHPVHVFGARDGRQLCYSFFMKDPSLYWPPRADSADSAVAHASGPWVGGWVDPGPQGHRRLGPVQGLLQLPRLLRNRPLRRLLRRQLRLHLV